MHSDLELTAWSWLLAFLPILTIAVLMLGLGWGGKRAGPAGLAVAVLVSWWRYGADVDVLLSALVRGLLFSVPVIYIIVPALILFHVAEAAGGIQNIGWTVSEMTKNHILQLMILAFGFTTFLQGVAGFGVPVAVVAPLLIGIGFPPIEAVAASLIGHAWSVSMGDMASSFQALLSVTTLPAHEVGVTVAFLLGICGVVTAVSISHLHGGWGAVFRWPLIVVVLGGLTACVQLFLAWHDLWIIATFGAGMLCLLCGFGMAKLPRYQGPSRPATLPPKPESRRVRPVQPPSSVQRMSFHLAFVPYYALIGVVAVATFVPFVHDGLHAWKIAIPLKQTSTLLGFVVPAKTWRLAPLGHPGALLLYTSCLGWLLYRLNHRWPGRNAAMFHKTLAGAYPTVVGVLSLVTMASVMTAAGMIRILAEGAATVTGSLFPFFAPVVGLMGCFVTGSNTNSNILFGAFQTNVAELIGKNPVVIGAAQSAGGSLGSIVAPAKVLVGCSTAGLGGREGEVFRRVAGYCAFQVGLVGLVAWWLSS
jgi:lactate permease